MCTLLPDTSRKGTRSCEVPFLIAYVVGYFSKHKQMKMIRAMCLCHVYLTYVLYIVRKYTVPFLRIKYWCYIYLTKYVKLINIIPTYAGTRYLRIRIRHSFPSKHGYQEYDNIQVGTFQIAVAHVYYCFCGCRGRTVGSSYNKSPTIT